MLSTLYAKPSQAEADARRANAPAVRLLTQVLQRDPPGPPTDDRLAQSGHFTDMIYLGICALADGLAGSTLKVMRRTSQPVFRSKKSARLAKWVRKSAGVPKEHHDDELVEAEGGNRFVRLFEHVNENDTLGDLLTGWVVQKQLTGTAFLWCRPSVVGYGAPPAELYVLPTALMMPLFAGYGYFPSGAYPFGAWRMMSYYPGGVYAGLTGPLSALGAVLDGREVKRDRMYHPLYRWDGYSPLTACGVEFDVVESIAQSWKAAMDHGFRPDALATVKGATVETIDAVTAMLEQRGGGSRNSQRIMVTNGEGLNFEKFFTEPRQMDYDKAWESMSRFALAVMKVPPKVAGLIEGGSYAELYAALKQFYTLGLGPRARGIGQFLTKKVVYPFDREMVVQLEVPKVDDEDFDLKKQDLLAKYGALTIDELRGWADKEPLEDGTGGQVIGKEQGMGALGAGMGGGGGNGEQELSALLGQVPGGEAGGGQGGVPTPGGMSSGSMPGRMGKAVTEEWLEGLLAGLGAE